MRPNRQENEWTARDTHAAANSVRNRNVHPIYQVDDVHEFLAGIDFVHSRPPRLTFIGAKYTIAKDGTLRLKNCEISNIIRLFRVYDIEFLNFDRNFISPTFYGELFSSDLIELLFAYYSLFSITDADCFIN